MLAYARNRLGASAAGRIFRASQGQQTVPLRFTHTTAKPPKPKPELEIDKLPKSNTSILSLLHQYVATSLAKKPSLPSPAPQSGSASSASAQAQAVHRVDHDPWGAVNMFMDPTTGAVKHSQKSFVNSSGQIVPPGKSLRPIPQVRGKPADKEKSGLTSFAETAQSRYAPRGKSSFMLSAQATPQNSISMAQVRRALARSKHPALKAQASDAGKKDVGVPPHQPLTEAQKLAMWNARDTERLMYPRQNISAIHRLVPRKTPTPSPEILARHGLGKDASWIDVDEARAKKQGRPFERASALETHRKITVTPRTLGKVQNMLAKRRTMTLVRQIRKLKNLHATGNLSTADAQTHLTSLVRQHEIGARRLEAERQVKK